MDSANELAALNRIIICIKKYRSITDDYNDLFYNSPLDIHLQDCLIAADYLFWEYVRNYERAKLNLPVNSSNEKSSLLEFSLLLSRYKRSIYEKFYWHWEEPDNNQPL